MIRLTASQREIGRSDLAGRGAAIVIGGAAATALAIAIMLRLSPLLADFPIGDGGLFWVMANELRENSFVPPDFTAYNGGEIPWMYPPIGLYLLALLGADVMWLRVLPTIFTLATLPAFWLLARSLIGQRAALFALIAYGLAPTSYIDLVSGGGVTRAPGAVLALLTLWAVADRRAVPAGILGGLTILTHPLAALYAGIGSAALWVTQGRHRGLLMAPAIAVAMGAAWFMPMTLQHGLGSLLSGVASRGGPSLTDSALLLAKLALSPPTLAVIAGAVGIVIAWQRQRWDLLTWLAVTSIGVGVSGRWTIIPLAVLAGLSIEAALEWRRGLRQAAFLALVIITGASGVLLAPRQTELSPADRATMAWVSENTPQGATVAVIGHSADGAVVEWMPALTARRNVTTAQGSEWLAAGNHWLEARRAVRCQSQSCLPKADYYILGPGCCEALATELRGVGPNVYERRP